MELVVIMAVVGAGLMLFAGARGTLRELHEDESGAHLIEYSLVAVLVVLFVLGALRLVGVKIELIFQKIAAALT